MLIYLFRDKAWTLEFFNTPGFLGAFTTETSSFKYLYFQVHQYNFGHSNDPNVKIKYKMETRLENSLSRQKTFKPRKQNQI